MTVRGGTQPETILSHAIRAAVVESGLGILWRNNVGTASYGPFNHSKVRYGLAPGSADLVGMLTPSGRFLAIEVKTELGRLTEDQKLWGDVVTKYGGLYIVARSVDEALAALRRAT